MPDTVTTKVLFDDVNYYIAAFTNVSDGTGESAVKKVDVSALSPAATTVSIEKVWYSTFGMAVKIAFDATTDDVMLVLQGDGKFDFSEFAGVFDPKSAGYTGDIFFTTVGHTSGDTYTVILKCRKY
jgi:hypothetical protein